MIIDPRAVEVLLCDAEDSLFPSEDPAYEASSVVTNRLLEDLGVDERLTAGELRDATVGRSFRTYAAWLAAQHGRAIEPACLERYVREERREVIVHLTRTLTPDLTVRRALRRLSHQYRLAIVSPSGLERLAASCHATALSELFPPWARISAEDSLHLPASKPDPAVYAFALRRLGVSPGRALVIDDSVSGVQAAVGAGLPVLGNLHFVPEPELPERAAALLEAGAIEVAESWPEIADRLALAKVGV